MSKEVSEEGQTHHHGKDYVDPRPALILDIGKLKLWSFYRALITEFIQNTLDQCGGVGLLVITCAFGGMIFILVYCTAVISGKIRPLLSHNFLTSLFVAYMVAQSLGAICGVGLVKAFMKHDYNSLGGGANFVALGYNKDTAFGAEVIDIFVLVLAPLPIGFAVFVVYFGLGYGSMNFFFIEFCRFLFYALPRMKILIFRSKNWKIRGTNIKIKGMFTSSKISGYIAEILADILKISISISISFCDSVVFLKFR
ncbi:hypothetical protein UlMin_018978 [Ulmus minor]